MIETRRYFVLLCDGCPAEGPGEFHDTHQDARISAAGRGWKFPAKITASGTASSSTNDVCPKCADTWVPRRSPVRGRNGSRPNPKAIEGPRT